MPSRDLAGMKGRHEGTQAMMLDWNGYLKQVTTTISEIAAASPHIVRGYAAISGAGRKTAALDDKSGRGNAGAALVYSARTLDAFTTRTSAQT
jgi:hypothetical protein